MTKSIGTLTNLRVLKLGFGTFNNLSMEAAKDLTLQLVKLKDLETLFINFVYSYSWLFKDIIEYFEIMLVNMPSLKEVKFNGLFEHD